ncbi:MAG: Fe-S-containing hydro-lyase [Defluviitaleaceae bacterium]|nr:Fe-S-containing hydro-lyase [Defluviitaleaceae bacterium]
MKLNLPLTKEKVRQLKAGELVHLTGTIYTARDAAHKRLVEWIEAEKKLPFELKDSVIYYVGPSPAKPGDIIGSAGPTTSSRMDKYSPLLLDLGSTGMIGKGGRSETVIRSMKRNHAVYFAAVGGAAALLAQQIKSCEVIGFEDLGTEAIHRLEVEDFPVIVAIDHQGTSLFTT